jgi:hypothetical protein
MDGSRANRLPYLTPVLELVRRFRTLRRIHLLAVFFDGGSSRILPTSVGKDGAVLHALFARGVAC